MSMSNNEDEQWQQVARGKSKAKVQQQISVKKMPKVKNIDSIQTLLNQYDPNDVGEPLQDSSNRKIIGKPNKAAVKQLDPKPEIKKRPKKPVPEPKFSYKSIDEALAKDNFELQEKYEKIQISFPGNTSLWLKEISHYLNMKISCPEEVVTAFHSRPFDFPLSNVKKDTSKILKKLYHEDAKETLASSLFFQYVVLTTDCIARDIPVWGYRLCIQTLAQTYPKAICKNLDQYKNRVSSLLNVPNQCLAVVWSVGQLAKTNHKFGFKVWLEVMLPNIHNKQVAQYAVPYIEMVLNKTKNPAESLSSSLHVSDFVQVSKLCYSDSTTVKRTVATRDRLRKIFPVFQKMLLLQKSNLSQVFGELLEQSLEDPGLSPVFCEVMTECLQLDPSCFKVWRDNYMQHIPQSKVLLSHLNKHWSAKSAKLPRKPFQETVRVFINTNNEVESKQDGLNTSQEFKQIKNLCTTIQNRFKSPVTQSSSSVRSSLIPIFFGFLIFLVLFIYYDLRLHNNVWEKSLTYEFLKSNGVLIYVEFAWNKVDNFTQITISWLTKNIPMYLKTLSDIFGPYFNELLSYLHSVNLYFLEVSKPLRSQVFEKGAEILEFIGQYVKAAAMLFLEVVDVYIDYGTAALAWAFESAKATFFSLQKLYKGEITWEHIQVAIQRYVAVTYDYLQHGLHRLGDYIAPNEP